MKEKICAFAPATIANVNVGFDSLGMALSGVGDKVEIKFNGLNENRIIEIISKTPLPKKPDKNCCTVVIKKMQETLRSKLCVDIRIKKGFASGSGLGSSSASSVAAAFAYNALAGNPFNSKALLNFAAEGERIACGSAHLDNVAPALLGGIVLLHENNPITLPVPKGLHAVSFFPNIEIKTSIARSIIPPKTSLTLTSWQVAAMGAFVAGLYRNDLNLIKSALKDYLIEPTRKILIPFFDEMRDAAMLQGAITFGISGSGPSVFALVPSKEIGENVKQSLEKLYEGSSISTLSFVQPISSQGGALLCNY